MKPFQISIFLMLFFIPGFIVSQSSFCDPVFKVMGLYDPDLPTDQNPAIFGDPLVKTELMSYGFAGKDKEYGDVDKDGDIDILYVTPNSELWVILNAGTVTSPDYRAVNKVNTGLTSVISFRLVDWYGDGVNDLVVLDDVNSNSKISLYIDISAQIGSPSPSALLLDESQYPINNAQLIEIGDIDGDHLPDLLVSGQGTAINGTALFQLTSAWTFPPTFDFVAPQTLIQPMIPEFGLSFPCPELFDADCDGDLDLFISDPWWTFEGGGHVDYYENTGAGSPLLYFTQVSPNPFGLDDVPLPGMELTCDWVITRFVDFFGDGIPEAIAYNPCSMNTPRGDMFYYRNILTQDTTSAVHPIATNEKIILSPNPVVDELTVQSDELNLENLTVEVVDYFGRTHPSALLLRSKDKLTVDVNQLPSGIFFLKLVSNGKLVRVMRFVKVG